MEKLNNEDGQLFIKVGPDPLWLLLPSIFSPITNRSCDALQNLASFVRTHEKALANALQLRRQPKNNAPPQSSTNSPTSSGGTLSSTSLTLAAALSFGALKFTSQNIKPAKLTLTPHHLFYLLSRFEELSVAVGPMNVRLENIHTEVSQSYVSFLNKPQRSKGDRDSIHSVSSVRSVMSGMSGLWSSFGLGSKDSSSKSDKAKAALEADLKYLYSAFTKIPCLRLAPDHRARLIRGYEEFPFDTAVPLHSFKNLSALEIIDIDYRSFYGWDRLSEQLRTLSIKRAHLDDPADLLTRIVLDDIDKRRRRSAKSQQSPLLGWNNTVNTQPVNSPDLANSFSAPGSPVVETALGTSSSPKATPMMRAGSEGGKIRARAESISPTRPATKQSHRHNRGQRIRRTGSGSSNSSETSGGYRTGSSSTLLAGVLPPSKWRFLRHLGLPENSLTSISTASLAPVASTLNSLDLSSNLLTEIPDSLTSLMALRALNLSHCMIESLHSLSRNPLPAITALNLRGNRLRSLAGIERLLSLERLDLRDNNLSDPTEMARLTSLPEIREIWVSGNPFVKTHSSYRVVIMNLFRRTPGYSEDIIIDGRGPGYTERKQLVERVAEPEGAPVVRSSAADQSTIVNKPLPPTPAPTQAASKSAFVEEESHAKAHRRNESDGGTNRRKKIQRRRIVDLSHDNPFIADGLGNAGSTLAPVLPTQQIQAPTNPSIVVPDHPWKLDSGTQSGSSSIQSPAKNLHSPSPPPLQTAVVQPVQNKDWALDEELCRQQLEALQQGMGHPWLTVLGGHPWDSPQKHLTTHLTGTGLDHSALPTSPLTRASSQAILSGGHALGG
ncbi:Leucine-rich repeat typical subtype [Penicillium alfredii]|uniref:Leucine-rich repeat typical subtype n=1 Tax=Penicillium alfredii TaxID=1506179 RepID=A0A9W9EN67_9EURO|nr:Leucine-rich repeat typical subtype [Penicillium alfredii]KAJ5084830.1 Leucine-rich repeat typical subtype [Penicillium alfredii]